MSPDLSLSLSPFVLVPVAAVAWAYARRWRAVRTSSSSRRAEEAPLWRLCCFLGALVAVLVALVSPLDALADQLFFMHMVQHVLLLDVVPILAILGLTKVILRPLTRTVHDVERRAGPLAHPAFAVVLYVAVIWAWHVPAAYDAAVRHSGVHVLEHLTFVLAGSLYWWHLLSPIRARLRLGGLGPVLYMGSTKVLVGALGMGLAFAPSALYAYYEHHARVWGISALDDQAMAGLIMAVEQSIVMGTALVVLFVRALAESEREQQRQERYEVLAGPR
ncbi:MAG TPA: cytochrome c oxidase assembly protein [Solirubrobacteraceae bacterium]|jgi:cytochrome c oxidase assembly factor CtaG|nr:cytochrome c oxidase assembly protein [Solirubrobacteraceae bacterium]